MHSLARRSWGARLRRSVFVVMLLVLIYVVALGALAVWLERALPGWLGEQLGGQAQVERVQIDPFGLGLDVQALEVRDRAGHVLLSLPRAQVRVAALALLQGTLRIREIQLQAPQVMLVRRADGQLRLGGEPLWRLAEALSRRLARVGLTRVHAQWLAVRSGRIDLHDLSGEGLRHTRLTPVDLWLQDVADHVLPGGRRGPVQLTVGLPGGGVLELNGLQQLQPLIIEGRLQVRDAQPAVLAWWPERPDNDWRWQAGRMNLETAFSFDGIDGWHLELREGVLQGTGLRFEGAGPVSTVQLRDLALEGLQRDPETGRWRVRQARLGMPVWQADDLEGWGRHLVSLLDLGPADWQVEQAVIEGGQVWLRPPLAASAHLLLEGVSAHLNGVAAQPERMTGFELRTQVRGAQATVPGTLILTGQFTRAPLTLSAALAATRLPLAYWPASLLPKPLQALDGHLDLHGQLDLDRLDTQWGGSFVGALQVHDSAFWASPSAPGLRTLSLDPVRWSLHPYVLDVGGWQWAGDAPDALAASQALALTLDAERLGSSDAVWQTLLGLLSGALSRPQDP